MVSRRHCDDCGDCGTTLDLDFAQNHPQSDLNPESLL